MFPSPGCGRTSTPLPILEKHTALEYSLFPSQGCGRTSTQLPIPDTHVTVFQPTPSRTSTPIPSNSLYDGNSDETIIRKVDNLSCIKIINASPNDLRESDAPFTSTMIYPQCSTPRTKRKQRLTPSTVYLESCSENEECYNTTPESNVSSDKRNNVTPVNKYSSDSSDSAYGSSSNSTPTRNTSFDSDHTTFMQSPMCKRAVTTVKSCQSKTDALEGTRTTAVKAKKRTLINKMKRFTKQFQNKCSFSSDIKTLAIL